MTKAEELKAQGYEVELCRGCGKPMVFGRTPTGSWIPLDPVAPVYTLVERKDFYGKLRPEAVRTHLSFVSHFVTCSKREQFSGRK